MTNCPLSLFEEYMFLDDTPSYPMAPMSTLIFRGRLDLDACRAAYADMIARHFLLRARVERRGRKLFWRETDDVPDLIVIDADADSSALNSLGLPKTSQLDLTTGPGLRVYCVFSARENWSRLHFYFHHAIGDGLGVNLAAADWLFFYGRRVGAIGDEATPREVNDARFNERGMVGWTFAQYLRYYFHTWRTTLQHTVVYPRPLVFYPSFKPIPPATDGSFTRSFTLSREETTRLLQRAKTLGATVNDVLLTDFFRANERWLHEVRRDDKRGKLRVMIPINMRTRETANLSCCDVVSTVFLDRTRKELRRTRDEILQGVAREMNWVKERDQKRVFLLILRVLRCVPGSLRFFLRTPTCRASTVFSNLGRVFDDFAAPRDELGRIQLGNVTLAGFEGKSPIRRKTTTACVASSYAGELTFTLCYDSRLLADAEAIEFNRVFREELISE